MDLMLSSLTMTDHSCRRVVMVAVYLRSLQGIIEMVPRPTAMGRQGTRYAYLERVVKTARDTGIPAGQDESDRKKMRIELALSCRLSPRALAPSTMHARRWSAAYPPRCLGNDRSLEIELLIFRA